MAYIETYFDKIKYNDQCVLNLALATKWKALPFEWNVQYASCLLPSSRLKHIGISEVRNSINNPKIMHFSTSFKPWHSKYILPYQHVYHDAFRKTFWSKKEGAAISKGSLQGFLRRAELRYSLVRRQSIDCPPGGNRLLAYMRILVVLIANPTAIFTLGYKRALGYRE